jgi:nucleoside-diphosphate-sugar epimerase
MEEAGVSTVLVTGGSGFIGSYCVMQLLAAGQTVRATVRDLKREADVRAMLRAAGADAGDRLSFFAATSELGKAKNATGKKARRLLGWTPRSREDAIVAAAESLLRLGLLRDSPKKA